MRTVVPLFLLLATLASGSRAFEAGLFPFFSYTASGSGMGNAVASLPSHPSNLWTNPAGIAFGRGYRFYAAPHDEVNGVRDEVRDRVFALTYGRGRDGFGGAFLLRRDPNQAIVRDGQLERLQLNEPSILLSYGRRVGETYAVGATLLGYQQRADREELHGDPTVGVTVGALRVWPYELRGRLPVELRAGLALVNFGPSYDVGAFDADLPLNLRAGLSAKWEKDRGNHLVLGGDAYYLPHDEGSEADRFGGGIGVEGKISGVVAIRTGYVWDADSDRSEVTYGFGIGNEVYPHIGGSIEYAHGPGTVDFVDHIGVAIYYVP